MSNTKRNRKRPPYLDDFYDSEDEHKATSNDTNSSKGIENDLEIKSLDGHCCVCEAKLTNGFDIESSTGSSELTYATVLNNVFQNVLEENSLPRLSFRTGQLCAFCKVPIQDLDLLQHKVIGVTKVIISRLEKKLKGLCKETVVLGNTNTETKSNKKKIVNSKAKPRSAHSNCKEERNFKKDAKEKKDCDSPITMQRPKRDKPENAMSEIERAKIRNLPTDMKFQVKKRAKKDLYIIEYLKEKKGSAYLVKWENRHESENSWENRAKIPKLVLDYYEEDLRRLGTQVPIQIQETEKVILHEATSATNENIVPLQLEKNVVGEESDEDFGEYIEPICEDLMTPDKTTASSKIEMRQKLPKYKFDTELTEFENSVRKSKREPKPKKFDDEILCQRPNLFLEKESSKCSKSDISSKDEEQETFIIEALVQKKGEKYLVKWENYSSDQNTWEPKSSLPKFIVKFYEQDLSRLGMPAPDVS